MKQQVDTDSDSSKKREDMSMIPYILSFAAGSSVGLLLLGIGVAVFW